jgi:hypothetical protein
MPSPLAFCGFCTSRIHNFVVLTQEQKYITWALQWIGASECSALRTGLGAMPHDAEQDEGNRSSFYFSVYIKKTKTLFGGGGQSVICAFSVCCRGSWNLNLAKSEGWVYCILSSNTACLLGKNQVTLFCYHNADSTWYRFLECKKLLPGLGTKTSVQVVVFNYRNMCLSAVTARHHFSWVLQTVWCQKVQDFFQCIFLFAPEYSA